jgi:hypothetical protein
MTQRVAVLKKYSGDVRRHPSSLATFVQYGQSWIGLRCSPRAPQSWKPCLSLSMMLALLMIACQIGGAEEPSDSYTEPEWSESSRDHWSLKPRRVVQVPQVASPVPLKNPIDHFIADRLQSRGLSLQPEASRRILIRRVTLDLTGLLPESELVVEFEEDAEDSAYEQLVDRLLAQSSHGEHWAQHWLDLARFAETDGFEHDHVRPESWKYRDWVISSLNSDLPYDEFVRLQLAGDLLNPDDESAAIATQFCLSGPDMPDLNSQDERRHVLLNEITSTVGSVILGLQIGCAQCHDHKYDPVSQADFYRLRSHFEPAVQIRQNKSVTRLQQSDDRGIFRVMLRGDFRRPGPEVIPGIPHALADSTIMESFSNPNDSRPSRVRLAVALTNPAHPLTARVIVNRVWQQHFGTGLSSTPSDFGIMGQEPTHPELLDWLSQWFVDQGWSLKQLHRLIVTSSTWRQRSFLPADAPHNERRQWRAALEQDPENLMWSRAPRRRVSGEVLRDIMLQCAGRLNRKAGGPGIRPPLPEDIRRTLLKDQWNVTEEKSEHDRRSIYVFARRNLRYPIFEAFDRPAANESCSARTQSTTAPQSLILMNSEFSQEMSQAIADQIIGEEQKRVVQMRRLFDLLLGRQPTSEEERSVGQYLEESESDLRSACLVLLNSNEFGYID